jgi:HSP20 family protein
MNIVPWKSKSVDTPQGRSPLVEFRSEVNRLFDSFLREPFGSLSDTLSDTVSGWGRWAPTVDVSENETVVIVRAELPGIVPHDLDISVTGDRLTIAGEKKETVEKKDQDVYQRESRFGSFSRTISLPASVDQQQMSAEYTNGVLTVTLKKSPSATAKKIPIKTVQSAN